MHDYIIEVKFAVDPKCHKESPMAIHTKYIRSGDTLTIPEPPKDAIEHGFDVTDLVTITVYKRVY